MKLFRIHWYDFGGLMSVFALIFVLSEWDSFTNYELIMWFSFFSLLLHQVEEYRLPGTFPGMINRIMFKSDLPDRFPLNTNTAVYVNVYAGWTVYLLATILGEKSIWLGVLTMIISAGNVVVHTVLFNLKGKMFYNAGLVTCWILFVPIVSVFFVTVYSENLASTADYLIGITIGIGLNVFGIFKFINWLADRKTVYVFPNRNLLPADRKKK
ncbi:MAG: HXXEE domain-containing protein [Ignavibacteriaceae bacterium]|nr:HXXEE domain-containing protein [Ignavibacteriaceae bacterium]